MSKYPPFKRVTAGHLSRGDVVLVRDGRQDTQFLVNQDALPWEARKTLPHGEHTVTNTRSFHRQGWKRRSRYYVITLGEYEVECSSVQRWNLVTS